MTREQAKTIVQHALISTPAEDRYRLYDGSAYDAYLEGARIACEALDAAGAFTADLTKVQAEWIWNAAKESAGPGQSACGPTFRSFDEAWAALGEAGLK